jgi:hypothetical protein
VAYTDLLAACLQTLRHAEAEDLRRQAREQLHSAFRAALPNHAAQSPEELLMQVRTCPQLPAVHSVLGLPTLTVCAMCNLTVDGKSAWQAAGDVFGGAIRSQGSH